MNKGKKVLKDILQNLNPKKNPGTYIYSSFDKNIPIPQEDIIFYFKEKEGITLVMEKEKAEILKIGYSQLFSWITLDVHTSLNAIGLTAMISTAFADHKIPCNIVAALTHDHLFVPVDLSEKALRILHDLSMEI